MREYAFQKSSRPGRSPGPSNPRGDHPNGPVSPWPALIGFLGLCLLVGWTASIANAPAMSTWYPTLVRPPGTPPGWVFPVAWTLLYVMMGTAAWLVWWRGPQGRRQTRALRTWGWQLALNAAWSPAFFTLNSPLLGMLVIVPMLVMVAITLARFVPMHRGAAALMAPYLAWTAYATYLNAGFWYLNH